MGVGVAGGVVAAGYVDNGYAAAVYSLYASEAGCPYEGADVCAAG